jgi:hypothetical protein
VLLLRSPIAAGFPMNLILENVNGGRIGAAPTKRADS